VTPDRKLWSFLKRYNGATLEQLQQVTGLAGADLEALIIKYAKFFDFEPDPVTGKTVYLSLKVVFGKAKPLRAGLYSYEEIIKGLQCAGDILPSKYLDMSTIDAIVHHDQDKSPSCVGNATANCADIMHVRTTGERPTPQDWSEVRYDVKYNPDDPNCVTYFDIYLPQTHAAACAYEGARQIGHVTAPGAYIDDAVLYWKKEGLCQDHQWYHAKDGMTRWREPYPDLNPKTGERAAETAKKHKLTGFATIKTTDGMKRAILESGCILVAYRVPDTYEGWKSGKIRKWKGSEIGSHAGCIIGWDEDKRIWYVLQTWRNQGFPKILEMSYDFWNHAKVGAIALLGYTSAKFAQEVLYRTVKINVLGVDPDAVVKVMINDDPIITGKRDAVSVALQVGKTYGIDVNAEGRGLKQYVTITEDMTSIDVDLSKEAFEKPQEPQEPQEPVQPVKKMTLQERLDAMRERLQNIFKTFLKKWRC